MSESLAITNARILTPDGLVAGDVVVENGRISTVTAPGGRAPTGYAKVIDARQRLLTPGFIDLQVNGGLGLDFTADPSTIWAVAEQLPRFGVTAFLPTIITSPPATVRRAQQVLQAGPPAGFAGARPLGLHLEGPFLNPDKKGAHNADFLRLPDMALLATWSPATGVRLVTLAPEIAGAMPAIRTLAAQGVVVSAGHSNADLETATTAFDAGVRYGTHLFNAMPPLHHREPGLAGALLTDERATIGLIADGLHVHPRWLQLIWAAAAPRLNLVTDAMAALGLGDGVYPLGDRVVTVANGPRLPAGRHAGRQHAAAGCGAAPPGQGRGRAAVRSHRHRDQHPRAPAGFNRSRAHRAGLRRRPGAADGKRRSGAHNDRRSRGLRK